MQKNVQEIRDLKDVTSLITDGDHGAPNYQDNGVLYLLSESVQEGYINDSVFRYITLQLHESLCRSQLKAGDVLVTKTGVYFGKCAVIPPGFPESNTSAHVGIIRLSDDRINPHYLSTFINSLYGYTQFRRRGIKATRPEIKLVEFDDIKIPILGKVFQERIFEISQSSDILRNNARQSYTNAEQLLLQELGLSDWRPTEESVTTKTFADFQKSGRLDAEYYQPKYDEIVQKISSYKYGTISCSEMLVNAMIKLNTGSEYCYLELADIGKSGEIVSCTKDLAENLPSRARQKVRTNDVIVSSVEGSLPSCALITEDYDNAICSTGFHVMRSVKINSETLLLLMKSAPIQALLKKGCSGTILTAILPDALKHIELPLIRQEIQDEIASKIQESFALRKESKLLLDLAKHAVEVAIEQGEDAAMKLIKTNSRI